MSNKAIKNQITQEVEKFVGHSLAGYTKNSRGKILVEQIFAIFENSQQNNKVIDYKKLCGLADKFVAKIPKGLLHGDPKTVIGFEIGQFCRFVKKHSSTTKPKTVLELQTKHPKLYEEFLRQKRKFGVTFKIFMANL